MRVADILTGVLVIIGLAIMVGAIGHDDYLTTIGVVYPLSRTVCKMLIGAVLIGLGVLLHIIVE